MNENKLTAKEVFAQIVLLQKELTESSNASLHRLGDAVESVNSTAQNSDDTDGIGDAINGIAGVFAMREETLKCMLDFYIRLYNQCANERAVYLKQLSEQIKSSYAVVLAHLESTEMDSEDKASVFNEVTNSLEQLTEKFFFESDSKSSKTE